MFLGVARSVSKGIRPITFFTYTLQTAAPGIQSFSFPMDNPRLLQAISYARRGGHQFDFKFKVAGRVSATAPWIDILESPNVPNPITPEVDLLIPEADQRTYTEYLMVTESSSSESRIVVLDIGFKQLTFIG